MNPEIRNENGVFMKIVLIGANGKIGDLVQKALAGASHEIVKVGHKSGDFQVEIENRESVRKLYQAVGSFDAVAIAAGQVAFAPLSEFTAEKWQFSLGSKLMGQINLVSPTMQKKSESKFAQFFIGMNPVEGWKVGQAYKRAILGAQTGRVYKVECAYSAFIRRQ